MSVNPLEDDSIALEGVARELEEIPAKETPHRHVGALTKSTSGNNNSNDHHGTPTTASAPQGAPSVPKSEQLLRREKMLSEVKDWDFFALPDWVKLHPLFGAYLAEAAGTFLFVLTIALVEINNPGTPGRPDTNITPLPIGFMLMCMVFTFGYVSGGHFNPAVTFAVFLARRDKVDFKRLVAYVFCQCTASLGAGIVAMIIQGSQDIIVPDVKNDSTFIRKGFFAELIYTFALATVVLNVAYSRQEGNFYYGFAIGMTVAAGVAAVGGVSGGAFNPAVATGLQAAVCLVGRCVPLMHFWLYWLSPAVGAMLAAILFRSLTPPVPVSRNLDSYSEHA